MNDADREAIQDLFARLRGAEAKAPTRDPEAEAYIRDRLEQNPAAAYYMAQTVIAQARALETASERMGYADGGREDGMRVPEPQRGGGGLLGGLFGSRGGAPRSGPWGQAPQGAPTGGMFGGGGFLAGAAQTAAGVAGGVVLGNMITDLFDGDAHGGHQAFADTGGADDAGGGFGDGDGEDRSSLFGGGPSAGFGDDGDGFDDQG